MAMKNPSHPGDFIRTEIIVPAGLTVTAAAKALQVSGRHSPACSTARQASPEIWRCASRRLLG